MPRLESYRFGRLVANGEEDTRDVIVLPARVVTKSRLADVDSSSRSSRYVRKGLLKHWCRYRFLRAGGTPIRPASIAALRRRRRPLGSNGAGSHVITVWGEHCEEHSGDCVRDTQRGPEAEISCLLYTSDAADE